QGSQDRRGNEQQAVEAVEPVNKPHQTLAKPLMADPVFPLPGEGEWVGINQSRGKHSFADDGMPERPGILEELVAAKKQKEGPQSQKNASLRSPVSLQANGEA